jgi:hyperosmotically inducible protein
MGFMLRAVSLVGIAIVLLAGCQSLTGKTAGEVIDDATITAQVKSKLAGERAATLTRVDVDTNQGVVYLNGVVESAAMKQRASEIARQVKGVRDVVNNLRVQAG